MFEKCYSTRLFRFLAITISSLGFAAAGGRAKIDTAQLSVCNTILLEASELIYDYDDEGFYLENDQIFQDANGEYYLDYFDKPLIIPIVLQTPQGFYMPCLTQMLEKKPVRRVCYNCDYCAGRWIVYLSLSDVP